MPSKAKCYISVSCLLGLVVITTIACTGLGQQLILEQATEPCEPLTIDEIERTHSRLDHVAVEFQFTSRDVDSHPEHTFAFYTRYLGMFERPSHSESGSHAHMILGASLENGGCNVLIGFVDESSSKETDFTKLLRERIVSELEAKFPERIIRHETWQKILF